jgi:hypothetical protein
MPWRIKHMGWSSAGIARLDIEKKNERLAATHWYFGGNRSIATTPA